MSLHLQRDLDLLKKHILQLGGMVETAINCAIIALKDRRPDLAEKVFREEKHIDQKEVFIEEECLKILALHQPVAVDLRFIVVVLKVNNDLERIGDFAVNIASRSLFLSSQSPVPCPSEFSERMGDTIRTMLRNSLDSLVRLDVALAKSVIAMDNEVDDINRNMYVQLQALMKSNPATVERAISLLSSSRYLERVADLTTNIAEDVIFMVDGDVVRHQGK